MKIFNSLFWKGVRTVLLCSIGLSPATNAAESSVHQEAVNEIVELLQNKAQNTSDVKQKLSALESKLQQQINQTQKTPSADVEVHNSAEQLKLVIRFINLLSQNPSLHMFLNKWQNPMTGEGLRLAVLVVQGAKALKLGAPEQSSDSLALLRHTLFDSFTAYNKAIFGGETAPGAMQALLLYKNDLESTYFDLGSLQLTTSLNKEAMSEVVTEAAPALAPATESSEAITSQYIFKLATGEVLNNGVMKQLFDFGINVQSVDIKTDKQGIFLAEEDKIVCPIKSDSDITNCIKSLLNTGG